MVVVRTQTVWLRNRLCDLETRAVILCLQWCDLILCATCNDGAARSGPRLMVPK